MKVIILIIAVSLAVGLAFAAGALLIGDKPPANPLKSPSPEQIINSKDSYKPGDVITVLGTKCNTSKDALFITGVSYYERQEVSGPGSQVGNKNNGGREISPGCQTLEFPHTLPIELTPGVWRLEGTDCTATGPATPVVVPSATAASPVAPTIAPIPSPTAGGFCASWFTDSFKIVAP